MTLVSDTGPLIALAKIGHLPVLGRLGFASVCIPSRVRRELLGKMGPESDAIDSALCTFLRTVEAPGGAESAGSAVEGLDRGEREVLSLAASVGEPALVLMDDHAGRAVARQLGLRVTGTVGILLLAKKRGLVDHVTPLLYAARSSGYWLSDAVITQAQRLAGE
jgi:predicted nucleic acid-binding protein